jgi:hypothetical protein
MFKEPVRRGRSERRGEALHFSPAHPELPEQLFARDLYVKPLTDVRTKPGARRVLARQGRVGETTGFFNILLMKGLRSSDRRPFLSCHG